MTFSDSTAGLLLVIALAVVVVLGVVVALLALRLQRLSHAYRVALDPDAGEDVFAALQRHAGALQELREDIGVVHGNTERLRELLRSVTSRVAVVRYDAFDDMGGRLSFSAALLDENADGLVITAINGRTETRTYAKPVTGGTSEHNISDEEQAAIDAAMAGEKGEPTLRRKRRRVAS